MYTFIKANKFLRLEAGYGICFDADVDHALDMLYKIPLEDYNVLLLFNSYFSDLPFEVEFSIPEQDENFSFVNGRHKICSGGRMSLVINTDGNVTICERLVDDERFVVGNIKENTIDEIWAGKPLRRLTHPKRSDFDGQPCFGCGYFEDCIMEKGVCYARTSVSSKSVFVCDPFCCYSKVKMRFH